MVTGVQAGNVAPLIREPTAPESVLPATGAGLVNLSQAERALSLAGGALALGWGLSRLWGEGLLVSVASVPLLARGITGHCPLRAAAARRRHGWLEVEVSASITVGLRRADVFDGWRAGVSPPRFFEGLDPAALVEEGSDPWLAPLLRRLPALRWTSEVTHVEPNERMTWRARAAEGVDPEAGRGVEAEGQVLFLDAAADRGTEVHARIAFRPRGGPLGVYAADALRPALVRLVREDLRRFKRRLELGEQPTTRGQTSCRRAERRGGGA